MAWSPARGGVPPAAAAAPVSVDKFSMHESGASGGGDSADTAGSARASQIRAALRDALMVDTSVRGGGGGAAFTGLPILPLIEIVAMYVGDGLHTVNMAQLRAAMNAPDSIRNVTFAGPINHGKTTLVDCLVCAAGIVSKDADTRFMDTRTDSKESTSTVKSIAASLYFRRDAPAADAAAAAPGDDDDAAPVVPPILVNLIDTPGEIEFAGDLSCALRVSDGVVVVLDCTYCAAEIYSDSVQLPLQVETALQLAMRERVKPVLFFNKFDSLLAAAGSGASIDYEAVYESLASSVKACNALISPHRTQIPGMTELSPGAGNVGFGSSLGSWGFTLDRFALLYGKKYGIAKAEMMKRLWGNTFYEARTKKWVTVNPTPANAPNAVDVKSDVKSATAAPAAAAVLPPSIVAPSADQRRGFVNLVLQPIATFVDAVLSGNSGVYTAMIQKLGIVYPPAATDLTGKALLKVLMQCWLPASEAVLDLVVNHVPSPKVAQKYRVEALYSGPMDDPFATAIRNCDPTGPLMMYVSRLIRADEKGRFWAFGRVFSGQIATGQTVRIQAPDYEVGRRHDLFVKKLSGVALRMGRYVESIPDCPAGNFVSLSGIDKYIPKTCTIADDANAHKFAALRMNGTPLLRVSVDVNVATELPKLVEGLRRLAKSDPGADCYTAPTGEHTIATAGERQMECCMRELLTQHVGGVGLKFGKPDYALRESVTNSITTPLLAKSPSKHNRLWMTAQPLGDALCRAIDAKLVAPEQEAKARARILADEHHWDVTDARRIWTFGRSPDAEPNVYVDGTRGVQYIHEIKDSIVSSFQWTTGESVLCEEPMRGVRFDLVDVTMHADAMRRGAGQIMPTSKRVCFACLLSCDPVLLAPVYRCEISVPFERTSAVMTALAKRKGFKIENPPVPPRVKSVHAAAVPTPIASSAKSSIIGGLSIDDDLEDAVSPAARAHVKYNSSSPDAMYRSRFTAFIPAASAATMEFGAFLKEHGGATATSQLLFSHWARVGSGNGRGADCDPLTVDTTANQLLMAVRKRKGLKLELPIVTDYSDKL